MCSCSKAGTAALQCPVNNAQLVYPHRQSCSDPAHPFPCPLTILPPLSVCLQEPAAVQVQLRKVDKAALTLQNTLTCPLNLTTFVGVLAGTSTFPSSASQSGQSCSDSAKHNHLSPQSHNLCWCACRNQHLSKFSFAKWTKLL